MKELHAAIFDMDGLMIDSEPLQLRAMNASLQPYGARIEEDEWAGLIGQRGVDIFTSIREREGLEVEVPELLRIKNEAYHKILESEVHAMPGLDSAIEVCKRAGLRLALASSSVLRDIFIVLDRLGLRSVFDVVVSGEHVERGKPEPDIFLQTAELLGIPPGECVVLEDTTHGVAAAKAAGMLCIAVPNHYTRGQDFHAADLVLGSLADLSLPGLESLSAEHEPR